MVFNKEFIEILEEKLNDEFWQYDNEEIKSFKYIITHNLDIDCDNIDTMNVVEELGNIEFNLFDPCYNSLPDSCYSNLDEEMDGRVIDLVLENGHSNSIREHIARAYQSKLEEIAIDTLCELQEQITKDKNISPSVGM